MRGERVKKKYAGRACCYRQSLLYLGLCLAMVFVANRSSFGTTASEVKKLSEKAVDAGVTSQKSHESWVDEKDRLLTELERLENRLEHIQWQRKKISVYKADLEAKIAGLQKKAAAMEALNIQLLPILEKSLEDLESQVHSDLPGNLTERRKSLLQSKMVLDNYDMGLLDKTRAVLDAIAREVDLGHRAKVLEDEIEVDGESRRVKMLQVGRIGLYAMTLDNEEAYQWDSSGKKWIAVEDGISAIQEAIEMAEGVRLVGLSRLPVTKPEQKKGE
ncbi:MAG: hypothetical protein CSB23_00355 [Deltaproteobacteria bacterium]|nr:MAG: hypothetical protein CSB23_00355 [Deltaproteobacteria bacterium]